MNSKQRSNPSTGAQRRPAGNKKSESSLKQAAQAALALFLIGLGWTVWDSDEGGRVELASVSNSVTEQDVYSPETLERINRHMQFTEAKAQLRSWAVEIENFELGSSLKPGDVGTSSNYTYSPTHDFDSENYPERVYRDANPGAGRYDDPVLPTDRITTMVEQDQWLNKYKAEQDKAFVEQVKQNARAAGFELEINDQLQVVRIIDRRPNSEDRAKPNSNANSPNANVFLSDAQPSSAR